MSKLSEMIKQDITCDRIRVSLNEKLYEKLIQTMPEDKARLFLDSEFAKHILNTFIYNALGYLGQAELGSLLQDKIIVKRNEEELTAIRNSDWFYDKLITVFPSDKSAICPCGITRSDCTYHK